MNDKGKLGNGQTTGARHFDARGGLVSLDTTDNEGKSSLANGVTVDPGFDGTVAWGRWTQGKVALEQSDSSGNVNGNAKGNATTLHYVAFSGQPSLPVFGSYASFASTAPTVATNGTLVATGTTNSATGSINVAFALGFGGIATYSLSVPVPGQTFTLIGAATQTNTYGFIGPATIRSSGSGCQGGCVGSLGGGNAVSGLLGGNGNSRLGVTYGFDSRLGNVSGVIVFKTH